jgi:hypothetical protein
MALELELVPGRNCGDCAACCVAPTIDSKEFHKPPGVRCTHLCAGGCAIYEKRYSACRSYYCGWRCMDALGEEWRPDRSGVLFDRIPDGDLPPQYRERGRTNVRLLLLQRPPAEIMGTLYRYVAGLVAGGVLVLLAVPGPAGQEPIHIALNESLQDAAAKGDLASIEAFILRTLAASPTELFKPHHVRKQNPTG